MEDFSIPPKAMEIFERRYLPVERFADLASSLRASGRSGGELLSLEAVAETSLYANVLSFAIPALDHAMRRASISENIFVVLTLDARSPAFATKVGSDYIIGFDLKTAVYCLAVAGCVAHSDFYIEFWKQDRAPIYKVGCGPYYKKTWYEFLDADSRMQADIEEQVGLMADAAWAIIAHEYVHICHGHLAAAEMAAKDSDLSVLWRDPLTSRTLEFDADAGATLLIWASYVGPVPSRFEDRQMDTDRMRRALLGNYVAAKVLEVFEINSPPSTGQTHPPAGIRTRRLIETAVAISEQSFSHIPLWDRVRAICAPGRVVEEAYYLATGEASPAVEAYFQAKVGAPDELRQILGRWARIRPFLEQTKLGTFTLAPPSEPPC